MAKSRGRKFAELVAPSNGIFDAASLPTIPAGKLPTISIAKLENSTFSVNSESASIGGNITLDTGDITEHTTNKYFTDTRADARIAAHNLLARSGGTMTGNLTLGDNVNAYFGASTDLRIYHDGTNSHIINSTGELRFTGSNFAFKSDSAKLYFGLSDDLQIYHDGSHSYISDQGTGNLRVLAQNFQVRNPANNEAMMIAIPDFGVTLYYNNNARFATTSTGIDVTGSVVSDGLTVDGNGSFTGSFEISGLSPKIFLSETDTTDLNTRLRNAAGKLQIQTVDNSDSNPVTRFQINHSTGDISFYEDTGTTPKLEWLASDEDLKFADLSKAVFGAGSDLQIYHDGSNSYITDAGTGDLIVKGANIEIQTGGGNRYFTGQSNVARLYHTDNEKLRTTSTGVRTTGTLNVNGAYSFPTSDGTNGQVLQTDGSGNLTFVTGGGGAGDITAVVAGTNLTGGATSGSATVNLAGSLTSMTNVSFTTSVVAAPTTSNATAGAKLILHPLGSGRDYAIGIESSTMWFNSDEDFKWYKDGNPRMLLDDDVLTFYTASNNVRGYISATETNDAHLTIATSNNEDIAFKDGGIGGTTNFLIRGDGNLYQGAGTNLIWHAGNDGATSGLFSQYTNSIIGTGGISVATGSNEIKYSGQISSSVTGLFNATNNANGILRLNTHGGNYYHDLGFSSDGSMYHRRFVNSNAFTTATWYKVWTAFNDGAGSGLDADTVDGIQAASFLRSDTIDSVGTDVYHNYGPNSTWSSTLRVGGNGYTANQNNAFASVVTTNGNLHLDAGGNKGTYLNHYSGTAGVAFGSGASGAVAWMGPDGDLWKGSSDNTGSKYWHAGNDGAGSGLDADLLDGQQGSYYLDYNNFTNKPTIPTNNNQLTNGAGYLTSSNDRIFITDTRSAVRAPSYYDDRYVQADFTQSSNLGVSDGDTWSAVLTVSPWTVYASTHRQQQLVFAGTNLYRRTATSESAWGSTYKLWDAGNDGSGSGLDADTVDGIQAASFLRSDASDNFGSPSSNQTINYYCNSGQYIASAGSASRFPIQIYGPTANGGDAALIFHIGADYAGYFGLAADINDLAWGGWSVGSTTKHRIWHQGNDGSGSGLDADLLDGLQGSSYMGYLGMATNRDDYVNLRVVRNNGSSAGSNGMYIGYGNAGGAAGVTRLYGGGSTTAYMSINSSNITFTGLTLSSVAMSGTLTITNNSIRSASTSTWDGNPGAQGKIQYHSNRWYIVGDSASNRIVQFRRDGTDVSYIANSGNFVGNVTGTADNATNATNITASGTLNNGVDLTVKGAFVGPTSSQNAQNGGNYQFGYQYLGAWSNPYPDLVLGYHTGMRLGGYYGYGGTRIYNDHPHRTTSILFSVGNGDQHVRATNNIYAYTSDKRLKENFRPIENAVDKVKSINGLIFDWKKDMMEKHDFTPDQEKDDAGLIAQEVQKIMPAAIRRAPFDHDLTAPNQSKSGEEFLTVQYEKMVPLLVEAIKEQQKQIDELKKLLEEKE